MLKFMFNVEWEVQNSVFVDVMQHSNTHAIAYIYIYTYIQHIYSIMQYSNIHTVHMHIYTAYIHSQTYLPSR